VGFIERPESSNVKIITTDYILSKEALYQVDVAGTRFTLTPYLHAPPVSHSVTFEQKYRPTVISYKSDVTKLNF
jgi:2-keto-3-deoxy-6-phosphogluconate aldolase